MAVIRDTMPSFELFQPSTIGESLELLGRYGKEGWALAGGQDSFDWFKDRIRRPKAVVDMSGVQEMKGIRPAPDGGIEIGAMTTLTEVVRNPDVRSRFRLLSDAALTVATPQIRNQGTLGGNVSQDTRCWYYRSGWPCYRAGGNICYADTPTAINREHAIFGQDRCVAVNGSDTAPALIALDAKMIVRGRRGERAVDAESFFIGPSIDITRMTVVQPGELLVAIRIPATWGGVHFHFEKVRDRQSWDFALVNVAAAMKLEGGAIRDLRLAANGVAPYPMRLKQVEDHLRGKQPAGDAVERAGTLAIRGARPLRFNAFKTLLLRNLVRRAVRSAAEA
jgi:xanthine dehydrogenase YagS FAD-binding subunit